MTDTTAPILVEILPTKIWIENGMFGDRSVVLQHQGLEPFVYARFNYNYAYTSNSGTWAAAHKLALSLGASEPVEVRQVWLHDSATAAKSERHAQEMAAYELTVSNLRAQLAHVPEAGFGNIKKWAEDRQDPSPSEYWNKGYEAARAWVKMQLDCAPQPAAQPELTDALLYALDSIVKTEPAFSSDGFYYYEHHGPEGEFLGTQYVDPAWVIQEMVSIASNAIAAHEAKRGAA